MPKVLWAQRTTKKRVIDEFPFTLVFKTEALPMTLVTEDVEKNQRKLARNLDFLEEVRECAQEGRPTSTKPKLFTIKR